MTSRQASDLASRHLPAQGLRGLAVLMVVAYHIGFVVRPTEPGLPKSYAPGGFAGVDVFFVLSGFLITALLLEERQRRGGVSFRCFYARRAFRRAAGPRHSARGTSRVRHLRRPTPAQGSRGAVLGHLLRVEHIAVPAPLHPNGAEPHLVPGRGGASSTSFGRPSFSCCSRGACVPQGTPGTSCPGSSSARYLRQTSPA